MPTWMRRKKCRAASIRRALTCSHALMDVQSASESAFIYNEMLDGGGKRFESIAQKTRQYLEAAEVRDAIPLENQAGAVVFISEKLLGEIRVRMVEYTPGYLADHWCAKGHILLCVEGELLTELKDGRRFTLKPGMSYQVSDNGEPHRSLTDVGAKIFIVD